jgi:AcrR family transcriptional regulator
MSKSASSPEVDTRQRLLDAAEHLFAERGFAATSVRQITEAAGANLGAVNYHFRSKEGLYADVFARRAAFLREPVLAAAAEAAALASRNPEEAFRILGRAFLAPHESRDESLCLVGLVTREAIERCLPANVFGQEFFEPAIDAVARTVLQIRPDLTVAAANDCAHSYFAQLMHIVKAFHAGADATTEVRLEHAVRFTVAAVRHLEAAPSEHAHRKTARSKF